MTEQFHTALMRRCTTADTFLASDAAQMRRPLPVSKILRDATRMERLHLALSTASLRFPFTGFGSYAKSQAGWHVHGTHVFAIPVVMCTKTTGVSAATQGNWDTMLSPSAQQQQQQGDGQEDFKTQQCEDTDPPDDGAPPNNKDEDEDQRTAGPGPYRTFFVPNMRASRVWWTQHPEYVAWLMRHQTQHMHSTQQGNDPYSDAHRSMIGSVDLMRHVLARWDHQSKMYRSMHAPHEYQPPPQQNMCDNSAAAAHGSAVARLVQWFMPKQQDMQVQQQQQQPAPLQQQQQSLPEQYQPPRGGRMMMKSDYDYNNKDDSSWFAWGAWIAVALLLLFVLLASAYNVNWYWPYVNPRGGAMWDNTETGSMLGFMLLVLVLLFCVGWAVYSAVLPGPSPGTVVYPLEARRGDMNGYYSYNRR